MERYDIIFFKSNTLTGKIISFITRSEYCHVGLYFENNTIFDINIGRNSRFNKIKNYSNLEIYRVNGIINNYNAQKWIYEHYNLKYDIGEVLKFIFKINTSDDDNKFICSTLVLDFIKNCTNIVIPENTYIISPQDLIDLNLVLKIDK